VLMPAEGATSFRALAALVTSDLAANRGRPAVQLILFLLRTAQAARRSNARLVRLLGIAISAIYRVVAIGTLSIDIPTRTKIGRGLRIYHGFGLVVHADSVIGRNVQLRHNTTIGVKREGSGAPRIGDDCSIGPNVVVLGDVQVGEGATVGAGAVVVADVPMRAVVAGNPARMIRSSEQTGDSR
jgi:serine acetyltransferase